MDGVEEFGIAMMKIENSERGLTSLFDQILEKGLLKEAEDILKSVAAKMEKEESFRYGKDWLDDCERKLFQAYYALKDWAGAKRVVEMSIKPESKKGRIKRLEDLSGRKYEEI